jgi:hypothetical protein
MSHTSWRDDYTRIVKNRAMLIGRIANTKANSKPTCRLKTSTATAGC